MDEEGITAYWAERSFAGNCNSCQRRDEERVAEIKLRTTTFRLCKECAEAMIAILESLTTE